MTEVPEHLLQRTRDRRIALGLLSPDDAGAAVPGVAPTETPNTPAVVGGAAPAAAAAKAPVPLPEAAPPPPPPPEAPWVSAAKDRQKIPAWIMPVLLFLPIWAFMYVGLMEEPTREEGVIYEGGELYEEHCASCHGAAGGGGVGPAFTNGAVVQQFPDAAEQAEWIAKGTAGYEAEGRSNYGTVGVVGGSGNNMPGFADKLTAEEIFLVTYYERVELGGYEAGLDEAEHVFDAFEHGDIELEEYTLDTSLDEIVESLAEVRADLTETAAGG